jgi:transposase-like protein
MQPNTLQQAIIHFSDEETCFEFVARLRWPKGVHCPLCESEAVTRVAKKFFWQCNGCRKQFSVKVGTIMEDSPIKLAKWLPAIWLLASAKNGISSYELGRSIGVTQKTAWFMLHRIRLAMKSGSFDKFTGEVEADEAFIGGLAGNMHKEKRAQKVTGRGGTDKTIVFGLLERRGPNGHSRVRAKAMRNRRKGALFPEIYEHVAKGSQMYTDSFPSYKSLGQHYDHGFVDHAVSYVEGRVHTNGMENFWSLLKRSIRGTYVNIEPFHLDRYLDEQVFRFNTRKESDGDRMSQVVGAVTGRRLTYNQLTRAEAS